MKQACSCQRTMMFKSWLAPLAVVLTQKKKKEKKKRVFIMTADVIVAGPLDSDCNCEYPPPLLLLLLRLLLLFFFFHLPSLPAIVKRKNFSPLSPVMFKPFMLLCGCVGRVHNEVSTRDQRQEREKTHTDWKTDLNERR